MGANTNASPNGTDPPAERSHLSEYNQEPTARSDGDDWGTLLQEDQMDITTLLVIVLIILLLGGGWYGRGRWY